jgi:hypothetical protein
LFPVILAFIILLACGSCTPVQLDDPAVATERALVASLTALASDDSVDVIVVETPEPSGDLILEGIEFLSFEVENNYPDAITFYVSATSELPVVRVAFFNWLEGQNSRSLERVEFSSGETVTSSYTWDTERITVAPSTPIYFYWELEDEAGNIFVSDEMLVYYDDLRFAWNEINDEEIIVRWYEGKQEFGEFVYDTARISLEGSNFPSLCCYMRTSRISPPGTFTLRIGWGVRHLRHWVLRHRSSIRAITRHGSGTSSRMKSPTSFSISR